jgi:hypothetical protein
MSTKPPVIGTVGVSVAIPVVLSNINWASAPRTPPSLN